MSLILDSNGGRDGELWISGLNDILKRDILGKRKIGAVASTLLLDNDDRLKLTEVLSLEKNKRITHLYVPMEDTDEDKGELVNYLEIVAQFIQENRMRGKNTILNCHKGRSRSVTFAVYYISRLGSTPGSPEKLVGLSIDEIVALIEKERDEANPRKSFIRVLKHLQTSEGLRELKCNE